jgi:hypothetical protein
MRRFTQPTEYVRSRLPPGLVAHMRQRIAQVHASALAVSIDHVEFLRRPYGS